MNLKRLRILFALVMGLLILLCVWTYWNINSYIRTVGNIRQTNLTTQTTTQILSLIKDAETGHRGYQLTENEEYLQPYYRAKIDIPGQLSKLDSLSEFIPEIKAPADQLRILVGRQLDIIERILQATNWENSSMQAEEIRLMGEGKENMDEIRNVADLITKTTRKLVSAALEDEGGFKTVTPINLLVIALIAFGGILLLFTRAVMLLEDRDKKSKNLEIAIQDLKEETQKRVHTGNLLRNVLDNSRDVVMASTAERDESGQIVDFKFILINDAAARLTRQSQTQMLEKRFSEIFPKNHEQLLPEYRSVVESGDDFRREVEVDLDGHPVWFKILAVKFNDGVVFTFSDITKEKEIELQLRNYTQELKRSNEDLEQFAYVASHDLQEPLRKIRSFGDRLITKYHDKMDETGKDYIERMQLASGRMQNLIEDLLSFSRITRSSELPGKVDMKKLLEEISDDISDQISRENAVLEFEKMPAILGVKGQILRLFQNLISNAIKFRRSDEDPRIKISGEKLSALDLTKEFSFTPRYRNYVKITVSDNGIGFDDKYAEQIFNVFQRLHGKNEFEGTGIGLAICKKIVTHHGGIITAKSIEGIGSEFLVILPALN
ncbi:CHASE3 domain-containing protein [Algoriphagus aestuariicola]|uniref:histidine kinase n=1 Tax=Algoriphagus aestuariicola TaxID=1852016 RepID=A0ABS3BV24_9BACT|nr:CHASE3 domain-containing protein [Algoriphagus aestuariicola]MBN7802910.1 CHASE3 domain-containing protein [Algoriphagus aestuariicola]